MRRDPPPSYNDTWCGLFLSFIITFLFITSVLYILFDTFDNYISILSYYLSRRQSWIFLSRFVWIETLARKKRCSIFIPIFSWKHFSRSCYNISSLSSYSTFPSSSSSFSVEWPGRFHNYTWAELLNGDSFSRGNYLHVLYPKPSSSSFSLENRGKESV